MDAKEAVKTAISHVQNLFSAENIGEIGLEEVEYDEPAGDWVITIGFVRAWDRPQQSPFLLPQQTSKQRTYKRIRLDDDTGTLISIRSTS